MSVIDQFTRDQIRTAGESGNPVLLASAADIADTTPERVKQMAQYGTIPGGAMVVDTSDPMATARLIVERLYAVDGVRILNHYGGQWYGYRDGCHRLEDAAALRGAVYVELENANKIDGTRQNGELKFKPVKPNARMVNEILDAIRALCHLHQRHVAPCWLEYEPGQPPAGDILPMSNGLLHVPTRTLYPHTPTFWTHTALGFSWAPAAAEPVLWLKFLCEVFQDDPEAIESLQEWFGLMLLPDTKHQKILLIVGPKRSGKGTIARILTELLGAENVCAPTLASLSSPFGLASLINKLAAIVSDARLSARADQQTISERLLSISGEDTVTVPRKYASDWTGRLSTRFVVMTNELPRLADASGALASRFIVLNMTRSFYGREDLGLFDKLRAELPGILAWALEGYDRLRRRGYLLQPESAREAIAELEDLGSPVAAFVRDRCEVGPGRSTECKDVYEAWRDWCQSEGRDHPGTLQSFGRDLRAAVTGLSVRQHRTDFGVIRKYEGLGLI